MFKRLLACAGLYGALWAQTPADFQRDVQPIFEKSCFSCHGEKLQMGGLRLDSAALAAKTIQPGKSADSTLYQRVAGLGEQARMPMGGKPLDAAQIAAIKAWIDEGAKWPESAAAKPVEIKKHWAYIAPLRPALPPVSKKDWVRTPVDRFVLARLDQESLAPSPEADRAALLRRVSLDLIGLPPTAAEVDSYLADKSKNAYEKQVDRLLRSPHYGERWGRHWLDAARYADSDGFEKDKQRSVWFYRDYVINALNRDLPYNQFLIEQLAGDLLPKATQDQIVATGFLRNSMINEEGGVDPEQFRMEAMFDRMDAIGKGMLGLTIGCAQCHNHKFDPLKQDEYYGMFAFLNNAHESNLAVYTSAEQQKRAEIFRGTREIETELQHRTADWAERMSRWEATVKNDQPEWQVIRPEVDDISTGGQKYLIMKDGSFLAAGYAPTKHTVKFTVKTDLKNVGGFRLELLNDPNLPLNGPGRSTKGTGALTEFTVEARAAGSEEKPKPVKIARASADLNLPEKDLDTAYFDKSKKRRVTGPIDFAIDGKDETAWSSDAGPGRSNVPRKAVFVPEAPIENAGGMELTIYLSQKHGGWNSDDNQNNNLGRMRLSVTAASEPKADPLPANVREILAIKSEQRSPAQVDALFSYWRTTVPEWKASNDAIDALWKQHPEGASQLVLTQREEMRGTNVLFRGDFLKPLKAVEAGVPSYLNPLPKSDGPANRLTFARWVADRNAPTTARALVNRVWQQYFGTGIVATSEDLGKQADAPSHAELLDWLAVEFMDQGWSLKKLHRTIVTSATYRQSSKVSPELLARDPYNRLLARGARMRVEGEIVRDIALAASGLLNATVGGPSVYAPAPEFIFQPPVSYGPKIWHEEKGQARYRRALYTFRYRSVPYPMLQNFDTPNGDASCVRRSMSNTPLQALTTLNEPLFLEAARALAAKTVAEGGKTDESKLRFAVKRCLSREPNDGESATLLGLLVKQRSRYAKGELKAEELLDGAGGGNAPELAAWTTVARVLLNLDETITKE